MSFCAVYLCFSISFFIFVNLIYYLILYKWYSSNSIIFYLVQHIFIFNTSKYNLNILKKLWCLHNSMYIYFYHNFRYKKLIIFIDFFCWNLKTLIKFFTLPCTINLQCLELSCGQENE